MDPTPSLAEDWVALQCDSTIFVINRSTVSASAPGSLFELMFGCRDDAAALDHEETNAFQRTLTRNHTHPLVPYLLDRSPQYVAPLIQYLRTGELVIDAGISKRGVRLEAEYFGIQSVADLLCEALEEFHLEELPQPKTAASIAVSSNDVSSPLVNCENKRKWMPPACCTRNELLTSLRTMPPDAGLRLRGMCLNGISFARLDLSNTNFEWCSLLSCDFSHADLSRANFTKADATGSNFAKCTIRHALCLDSNFTDCCFENASVTDSNFTGSTMIRLQALQCDFSRTVLTQCNLSYADLCGTVLHQTQMRFTNLSGVERCGTNITMGGVIV
jgi:BTB/POZ domain-containing protein KCTD9